MDDNEMTTADVWYPMLRDIADEIGKAAVIQLCSSGRYPPGINEIRETALSLSEGDVVTASAWEAWERALEGRTEGEIEKRALNLVGGTWEIKNTKNVGVTRSNFVKAFTELYEADRRRRLAIPFVKALAAANKPEAVTPVKRQIEEPRETNRGTPEELGEILKGYRLHNEI